MNKSRSSALVDRLCLLDLFLKSIISAAGHMWNRAIISAVFVLLAMFVCPFSQAHEGLHEQIESVSNQLREHPSKPDLWLKRGHLHCLYGEWRAGLKDAEKALAVDSEIWPRAAVLQVQCLLKGNQLERAEGVVNQYLEKRGNEVGALLLRAEIHARQGRLQEAAKDQEAALDSQDSLSVDTLLQLVEWLNELGGDHPTRAAQLLEQGMEKRGRTVVLLEALAIHYRDCGTPEKAIPLMDELVARASRKEVWLKKKGDLLLEMGRVAEARNHYEHAMELLRQRASHIRLTSAAKALGAELQDSIRQLSNEESSKSGCP